MPRDKTVGLLLLIGAAVGILLYGWLVFFSPWGFLVLQLTAFLAVAGVLAILGWVGYALATTPPPSLLRRLRGRFRRLLRRLRDR